MEKDIITIESNISLIDKYGNIINVTTYIPEVLELWV